MLFNTVSDTIDWQKTFIGSVVAWSMIMFCIIGGFIHLYFTRKKIFYIITPLTLLGVILIYLQTRAFAESMWVLLPVSTIVTPIMIYDAIKKRKCLVR